jgi:hexokinase
MSVVLGMDFGGTAVKLGLVRLAGTGDGDAAAAIAAVSRVIASAWAS